MPPHASTLLASAGLVAAAPAVGVAAPVVSIPAPAPAVVQVTPGISYQRLVEAGGQVVHVLRARRSGLVSIRPELLTGSPSQRGALAATLAAESARGAVAAVNGDFFNLASAYPSGLTVTAEQGLTNEPEPTRSALVLGGDGSITAGRFTFTGTWQTIDATSLPVGISHGFAGINRPFERAGDTVLYTPAFGAQTPSGGRTDVLISLDGGGGQLQPNVPLTGTVAQVRSGGGTTIGSGMVLSASGTPGATLAGLAPGTRLRITPTIAGFPTGAYSLGGGPLLVDAGAAVTDAGEGFTSSQLNPHTARTAIGQTADGSYLLVSADGPDQGSPGITVPQQAQLMQRLGARIAVAMDSGGSAQMLIDGTQMVPWSSPRAVTDGMVLTYSGVRVSQVPGRITPNGDGLDDATTARVTAPQPGRLVVTLSGPQGGRHVLLDQTVDPGTVPVPIDPRTQNIPDGLYRLTAELAPQGGAATLAGRRLLVDRTLADLQVRPVRQRVGRKAVPVVRVAFTLTRRAAVSVRFVSASGAVRANLVPRGRLAAGRRLVVWNRRAGRTLVTGTLRVEVVARTGFGRPGLATAVHLAAPKKPKPTPKPATG